MAIAHRFPNLLAHSHVGWHGSLRRSYEKKTLVRLRAKVLVALGMSGGAVSAQPEPVEIQNYVSERWEKAESNLDRHCSG
jgi:hypothetical protein